MELEKYMKVKSSVYNLNEPEAELWKQKWNAPFNHELFDSITLTPAQIDKMLPQIETMQYSGSDLLTAPSLREFKLIIANEEGKNIIYFRKSFLPQREVFYGKTSNVYIPCIDAYVYYSDRDYGMPNVIVNIGKSILSSEDKKQMNMTYQRLIYRNSPIYSENPEFDDLFREYKFLYMLVQKALYDRPTVFVAATVPTHVSPNRKSKHKKGKRKVVMRKVLRFDTEEFSDYVKAHHEITCPSWGVIGHWRTYRNGNKIWIKPYRKGKERYNDTAYSAKEYTMLKED